MRAVLLVLIAILAALGCGGAPPASSAAALGTLRASARASTDGERVGRWALAEMLAPGGDAKQAGEARKRLNTLKPSGLYASLAAAIFDETHGSPRSAAEGFIATLVALRKADDKDAALIGWFATHHLLSLRSSVHGLYAAHKGTLEDLAATPKNLGWRAVAELIEWATVEAFDKAEVTGDAYDKLVASKMGCATAVRLAGPFGHGSTADRRRSFGAEKPGPWPPSWPSDPLRRSVPHVLKSEQRRCLATSIERTEDGVFYAETYFSTSAPRDMLVAAQGALKVWVDDAPVLERDLREWGVWQRFGAAIRVGEGRHRVVARLIGETTSVRLLNLDGTPAPVEIDTALGRPYGLVPPRLLGSPNPIDAIVRAQRAGSPLEALLASFAAHVESMNDVASVLIEPLATAEGAGSVALLAAATYAANDAALPEELRHRTEHDAHARAIAKDPKLWYSAAWLLLDQAEQRGPLESIEPLRKLADAFPEEPEILEQLARVYGKLGWHAERMRALADLEKRFADDVNALRLYLGALEEDGPLAEADKVAARIKRLEPDTEVDLDRALARHDWKAAIAELQRIGKRRPERKEIATRIADVLERAGDPTAAAIQLSQALAKDPDDSAARLRIADRAFAKGDTPALRRALAEALQAGAKGVEIREALDLIEGATNLEPYRVDGRKIIREFEAWEKTGKRMEGHAARVLDYSAIWVHPDASSEMLEHEIMRIQSQEAIGKEAEQQVPAGLVLRIRVIKPDGSILEPEQVTGKPTLTMPHLEVGDYVEIEHITPNAGDGHKGQRYRGPHWFFREADKGYWRSEFVCITPKDKPVEIETRGNVPPPKVKTTGTFVERRWRVDESPPAVEEPDSPPITEFLPSVRIGWGISLDDTILRLVDAAVDETPLDPRLHKKALEIVRGVPEGAREERARLVYKDVVDHVEEAKESDGRRAILGKSGSRKAAFEHLMRQLGIPIEAALVKDRLAAPPIGKMSEVEDWDSVVLRIETEHGTRWLTVREKFAPFGYVPAELRGQPAIRLVPGAPRDTTSNLGAQDGIAFDGRADLHDDGSATVELAQIFNGKIGISMRELFDKVPEAQLQDFIESRLLSRYLPPARVRDVRLDNKKDPSQPLVLHVHAEVAQLARQQGEKVTLKALFPMRLAQLATLPERQTPMLIAGSSHVEVKFEIVAPEKVKMPPSVPGGQVRDGERVVGVKDAVQGHALVLDRIIDIPAGRVQPGADYRKFLHFAQEADEMFEREIVLGR
jgi:tetratricopeptide (TPR) repeat protein